jgi:ABC-type uncharacterized transport system ATPase subunit
LSVVGKHRSKLSVNNVSFDVHEGEILCIAGIEGNGQTELIHAIAGMEVFQSGSVILDGKEMYHESIRERYEHGLAHIPEDRQKHGLVLDFDLGENIVLQTYNKPQFQKHGFIKFKNRLAFTEKLIEAYDIRAGRGARTIVRSMSGGNQQKAIVARELERTPKLIIAVTPTRGLDVGAIEYIHKKLIAQRDLGHAILVVSLELNEVLGISDRILVMYEGELVGEVDPQVVTQQELGLYMSGSKREEVIVDA